MSQIPEHLKYTNTHEWLDDSVGDVRVGITDHAQQLLGDLVFIQLPEVGQTVLAGDELGVLESVKAASDYYAPVAGRVVAVNQTVAEHPELLNTDPYGEAWLVKLSIDKPSDTNSLLSANEYKENIAEE